jgi:putative oxidoreductase
LEAGLCQFSGVAGFNKETLSNLGLLILRAGIGIPMASIHGFEKVQHYSAKLSGFPDPLHMGNRYSLILAVAAEFAGSILLSLGLLGRFAALLLTFQVGLTLFAVDAALPWKAREVVILYFAGSLTLLLLGCGRWSLDSVVWKRFRKGGGGAPAPGKR